MGWVVNRSGKSTLRMVSRRLYRGYIYVKTK